MNAKCPQCGENPARRKRPYDKVPLGGVQLDYCCDECYALSLGVPHLLPVTNLALLHPEY
jgi:hypothetical protein